MVFVDARWMVYGWYVDGRWMFFFLSGWYMAVFFLDGIWMLGGW
jgi:hypothetical protein